MVPVVVTQHLEQGRALGTEDRVALTEVPLVRADVGEHHRHTLIGVVDACGDEVHHLLAFEVGEFHLLALAEFERESSSGLDVNGAGGCPLGFGKNCHESCFLVSGKTMFDSKNVQCRSGRTVTSAARRAEQNARARLKTHPAFGLRHVSAVDLQASGFTVAATRESGCRVFDAFGEKNDVER